MDTNAEYNLKFTFILKSQKLYQRVVLLVNNTLICQQHTFILKSQKSCYRLTSVVISRPPNYKKGFLLLIHLKKPSQSFFIFKTKHHVTFFKILEMCIYVITVGADRPVNSCILESLRATSTCINSESEPAQKIGHKV